VALVCEVLVVCSELPVARPVWDSVAGAVLDGELELVDCVLPGWLFPVPPPPPDVVGAASVAVLGVADGAASVGGADVPLELAPRMLLTWAATGCVALDPPPPTEISVPATPPPASTAAATSAAVVLPRSNTGAAGSTNRATVGMD
jgi:hypothetical protein